MGVQYQEKLAGDLLLGLNFVKLEILSTSFIDFLYDKLGEFRSLELSSQTLSRGLKATCVDPPPRSKIPDNEMSLWSKAPGQ